MNHDSCTMKKVATEAAVRAGKPGAFAIVKVTEGEVTFKRLWAHLPDGTVGGFALEPAPAEIPGVWPWNGNETKPTLKRPVRLRGRWEGQINVGRMVSDPDPVATSVAAAELPPPKPNPVRDAVRRSTRRAPR
jgi:hypothetical protein